MLAGRARLVAALTILLPTSIAGMLQIRPSRRASGEPPTFNAKAEFYFLRMEYVDLFRSRRGFGGFGGGRGWWMQDWPEADIHFAQGVQRLTRLDVGDSRHLPLTDDRIFDYPWIYATQVGYWDLSAAEIKRLGDYLRRGGFLVVDDFYGEQDWAIFRESMQRVLPDRPILDIADDDSVMHVLYDIKERVFIPGLRHLRVGAGGAVGVQQQPWPPAWRAIYDDRGRMLVAINYNMDVGDAWEHADWPEYPEQMTALAYRFGINYIIYSMTH